MNGYVNSFKNYQLLKKYNEYTSTRYNKNLQSPDTNIILVYVGLNECFVSSQKRLLWQNAGDILNCVAKVKKNECLSLII